MSERDDRKPRKLRDQDEKAVTDPSPSAAPLKTNDLAQPQNSFSQEGTVTVAALLNLVRILGGELVLVRGLDVAQFEKAVREKFDQFINPPVNAAARAAGIARARHLVEQVLTQIRAQAEVRNSLTASIPHAESATVSEPQRSSLTSASPPKMLN